MTSTYRRMGVWWGEAPERVYGETGEPGGLSPSAVDTPKDAPTLSDVASGFAQSNLMIGGEVGAVTERWITAPTSPPDGRSRLCS